MGIKNNFYENGFVVINKLIPDNLINDVLKALEDFKEQKKFYYTQSKHNWVKSNYINNEGFLIESIQSPTKQLIGNLKEEIKNLISHKNISEKLNELSSHKYFINWQNMLFDKSTGTTDHADTWYLDTIPKGQMIACWIALENIHKDAGRFFVCPKSNHLDFSKINSNQVTDHYEYAKIVLNYLEKENIKRYAPPLKKGDVLFWHPFTIHGSFKQKNSLYSRKSITAHYHPIGLGRNSAETPKEILNYIKKMQKSNNKFIYFDNSDPSIFDFTFKSFSKFFIKKYILRKNNLKVDMDRDYINKIKNKKLNT